MLLKFFFKQLSLPKQVNYVKKKGVFLGSRLKEGRKIYLYMLNNLFVEILFKNDNADEVAERLSTVSGLKNLNNYLENELRQAFKA